jgi:hypothetical protein
MMDPTILMMAIPTVPATTPHPVPLLLLFAARTRRAVMVRARVSPLDLPISTATPVPV